MVMVLSVSSDAVAFFREHAGYSVDVAAGETEEQGRERTARELAEAESWAESVGVEFDWRSDPDEPGCFGCVASVPCWCGHNCCKGSVDVSLWGIDTDEKPYRRVVEAELADELRGCLDA